MTDFIIIYNYFHIYHSNAKMALSVFILLLSLIYLHLQWHGKTESTWGQISLNCKDP